jgi:AcrR family transcriptional regulator
MTLKATGARLRLSSEERKASIVAAAVKLFSEKGFRGTTTRELAAAVGVTEPVLYEHFKTKCDLYRAIIETKACEGIQSMKLLEEQFANIDDDRGFFTHLAFAIVDWYTKDSAFVRLLLFSNLEGHELRDLFHQRSEEFFNIVIRYIERRIAAGAMRPSDPAVAARAFFGMVAHYALTGLVFGACRLEREPKQVAAEMAGIFLQGMCTDEV